MCVLQVKEQKEEAERFQQKLKEMEDLKIESFLVQLFHINKVERIPHRIIVHHSLQQHRRRQANMSNIGNQGLHRITYEITAA